MPVFEPEWIAEVLGAKWSAPVADAFSSVETDTRTLKAGSLFVGIAGPTRHGQEFLDSAASSGAQAALVEAPQPSPLPQLIVPNTLEALQRLAAAHRARFGGKVIALTGSSGKTSTKELLAHLLGPLTHKTEANFNNHLGVPLTLLRGTLDAPFWVVEAGIDKEGEMEPLLKMIGPDAALLTLIGNAHLEFFKTTDATAAEKSKLLHCVGAEGFVVLHAREAARYKSLQNFQASAFVIAAENEKKALPASAKAVSAQIDPTSEGWSLTLDGQKYALPLWTPGMVQNAALCITTARQLGFPSLEIATRLATWPGVALRGEWVRFKGAPNSQRIYLDAYNCNPEGLVDALWKFDRQARRGRLYILSAMGELGTEGLRLQREAAAKVPLSGEDRVCLVGANTEAMKEGLLQAGMTDAQLIPCPTVEDVKPLLRAFAGDCFIKGSHYGSRLFTLSKECFPLSKT